MYISIISHLHFLFGWGTVIRTQECRSQSPMPYRLAIPQYTFNKILLHTDIVTCFARTISANLQHPYIITV